MPSNSDLYSLSPALSHSTSGPLDPIRHCCENISLCSGHADNNGHEFLGSHFLLRISDVRSNFLSVVLCHSEQVLFASPPASPSVKVQNTAAPKAPPQDDDGFYELQETRLKPPKAILKLGFAGIQIEAV